MNFVYTIPGKSLASETVQNFASFVFRQFEHDIQTIPIDYERSLGKDFQHWVVRKGIVIGLAATNTPAQNGTAEPSGGVLTAKARALWIHDHIPESIWPESIKAAAYLTS